MGRIEVCDGVVRLFRPRSQEPLLQRGRLPHLTGRTADQQLAALAKLVEAAGKTG